jgi:hypothetical protein
MIGCKGKSWVFPLVIVLIVIFSGCQEPVIHYSGTGTLGDPYIVFTAEGLESVREIVSGVARSEQHDAVIHLGADIDLNDLDAVNDNWIPVGTATSKFTGTFDGNGYVISNLRIDLSATSTDGVGFFGYVLGATIKNVGLHDVDVTGHSHVGAVAGDADSSLFSSICVTGSVEGTGDLVGGMVGDVYSSSSISSSYTTADVSGGQNGVGGLTGRITITTIDSSYATGNITGLNGVGGLCGYEYSSTIKNSLAANGTITRGSGSETAFHRVLGYRTSANHSSNYGNSSMTMPNGISPTDSATNRDGADATLAQFQSSAFFSTTATWNSASWNNAAVWTLSDGGYPKLVWED